MIEFIDKNMHVNMAKFIIIIVLHVYKFYINYEIFGKKYYFGSC